MVLKFIRKTRQTGMTLTEVVVSLGVGGIIFGGIVLGYIQSTNRAEWSAMSFAAHSLALRRIEQTRAAKWDTQSYPVVDQLQESNFPPLVDILDIPISGTNISYATSTVSISEISANPPLKIVVVNTTWSLKGKTYTNTAMVYRSPDQ